MSGKRITLNAINTELARLGYAERLFRGEGYFYFGEGEADGRWPSSSVWVYRLSQLSLDEWIQEYRRLAADARA
jgi:hypothetical protein